MRMYVFYVCDMVQVHDFSPKVKAEVGLVTIIRWIVGFLDSDKTIQQIRISHPYFYSISST